MDKLIHRLPRLGIAPAILVVVFVIKTLFPIFQDPDFYWHLKTGEYILAHGLPQGEMFTYTHPGAPLLHTEWLFQVIIFVVYKYFDLVGVSLFVAAMFTACWYVNYRTCMMILQDEGKAIITTLFFCATLGSVAPRPHLFTFLFFSLVVYCIFDFKYRGSVRKCWLIPPMMVVWANIHGGFFLGLVLFGGFIGSEWLIWYFSGKRNRETARPLLMLSRMFVIALFAPLATPEFWHTWWFPFEALVLAPDTKIVSEWQSPDFHQRMFQYFYLTVLVFWIAAVYARRKPDLTELAVPSVFVFGAFYSARNVPLAALTLAPFFAVFLRTSLAPATVTDALVDPSTADPLPSSRVMSWASAGNRQVGQIESGLNWLVVVLALAGVALAFPMNQRILKEDLAKTLPVHATDFLLEHHIEGRIYNVYHHGGYLIHRLPPDQKVFVYPRTDYFKPGFFKELVAGYGGDPNWKKHFDQYNVDHVICESASPLRQLLVEGKEFRLVYDDGLHSVLLRDIDKFRPLIEKYGREPVLAQVGKEQG